MSNRRDGMRADSPPGEELVALVMPVVAKDVTYLSTAGEIRFVEGRSVRGVPLSVARDLAGPGWWIEPLATDERS